MTPYRYKQVMDEFALIFTDAGLQENVNALTRRIACGEKNILYGLYENWLEYPGMTTLRLVRLFELFRPPHDKYGDVYFLYGMNFCHHLAKWIEKFPDLLEHYDKWMQIVFGLMEHDPDHAAISLVFRSITTVVENSDRHHEHVIRMLTTLKSVNTRRRCWDEMIESGFALKLLHLAESVPSLISESKRTTEYENDLTILPYELIAHYVIHPHFPERTPQEMCMTVRKWLGLWKLDRIEEYDNKCTCLKLQPDDSVARTISWRAVAKRNLMFSKCPVHTHGERMNVIVYPVLIDILAHRASEMGVGNNLASRDLGFLRTLCVFPPFDHRVYKRCMMRTVSWDSNILDVGVIVPDMNAMLGYFDTLDVSLRHSSLMIHAFAGVTQQQADKIIDAAPICHDETRMRNAAYVLNVDIGMRGIAHTFFQKFRRYFYMNKELAMKCQGPKVVDNYYSRMLDAWKLEIAIVGLDQPTSILWTDMSAQFLFDRRVWRIIGAFAAPNTKKRVLPPAFGLREDVERDDPNLF